MKASERLRLEASLGNNVYQPWPMVALREAADLLDECEKALHNAAIYRENADFTLINDTLARLRGEPPAQEKSDETI